MSDVDWESIADRLAKTLKWMMSKTTFHGHTPCCGTHRTEHKEECLAMKALVLHGLASGFDIEQLKKASS